MEKESDKDLAANKARSHLYTYYSTERANVGMSTQNITNFDDMKR